MADARASFARSLFGGPLAPRQPDTTPATRTPDYYADNPNYPYPRETFPPPPEGYTGRRGRHGPTGLPAYPIPPSSIPPGEEGFYGEEDESGLVEPRFPHEWDADIQRDPDDTSDELLGGFIGGEGEGADTGMMDRAISGGAMSQRELSTLRQMLQRVGGAPIAPDLYAPRISIDRYLPSP